MKKFQLIVTADNGKHINTHDIEATDKKEAGYEAMEIISDLYMTTYFKTELVEL